MDTRGEGQARRMDREEEKNIIGPQFPRRSVAAVGKEWQACRQTSDGVIPYAMGRRKRAVLPL